MKRTTLAVLVPLVLSGCGGRDHPNPPPAKAAFVAAADRICSQAATHSDRLARLRALRAPRGTEDLYAHWLKAERDALEAAKPRADPPDPDDPDPAVARVIAEGKIAGYARRLGAEGCARSATGTLPP